MAEEHASAAATFLERGSAAQTPGPERVVAHDAGGAWALELERAELTWLP